MNASELADHYRAYIDCLNRRDWNVLGRFVAPDVRHNGRALGLSGYRAMLEGNYRDIPDLRFRVDVLVCEPPLVASRLWFDCTPKGTFLGLPVNGRRVAFAENAFYRFADYRIEQVWSVLDKAAVETQLQGDRAGK